MYHKIWLFIKKAIHNKFFLVCTTITSQVKRRILSKQGICSHNAACWENLSPNPEHIIDKSMSLKCKKHFMNKV